MSNLNVTNARPCREQPSRIPVSAVPGEQNESANQRELRALQPFLEKPIDRAAFVKAVSLGMESSNGTILFIEPIDGFRVPYDKRHLFVIRGRTAENGVVLVFDPHNRNKSIYFHDPGERFLPKEVTGYQIGRFKSCWSSSKTHLPALAIA